MNAAIPDTVPHTAGLVLAGGQSRRMGKDKALLSAGEQPLFQHMSGIISQTPVAQVLLSSSTLNNNSHLPLAICDSVAHRGPMGGIYSVLQATSQIAALLIIPVDMPLMQPTLLTRLFIAGQSCNCPVIYCGKTLPLYLPINPYVVNILKTAISSQNHRDYSLLRLHQQLNGKTIPIPSGHAFCFQNANTPEEWAYCKKVLADTAAS
ncbi:Molybdenum cofactor guanylyltransferase [invertebrate metagenome]|uniref:Molybdenum cofactor guanylyltransferase n=1 Tax=invertebrate metagenome TaxID=1711999 RepID=A0A2H9TCQ0_9ZZZZ